MISSVLQFLTAKFVQSSQWPLILNTLLPSKITKNQDFLKTFFTFSLGIHIWEVLIKLLPSVILQSGFSGWLQFWMHSFSAGQAPYKR